METVLQSQQLVYNHDQPARWVNTHYYFSYLIIINSNQSLNQVQRSHQPKSTYELSPHIPKLPLPMRLVILKLPTVLLAIRQVQHSLSFLHIVPEVSLVLDPFIAYFLEVVVVVGLSEGAYAFVVENAVAIQSVLFPLALVGDLPAAVVQHPSALHPVPDPFSAVFTALVVVESAEAVPEVAEFVALVSAFLQDFAEVLRVLLDIFCLCGEWEVIGGVLLVLSACLCRSIGASSRYIVVVEIGAIAEYSLRVELVEPRGFHRLIRRHIASSPRAVQPHRLLELIQDYPILLSQQFMILLELRLVLLLTAQWRQRSIILGVIGD